MSASSAKLPATSLSSEPRGSLGAAGLSDQDLLRQYVGTNSQRAFAALVRRHQQMVIASAYRICANESDAQDVLQHSFSVLAKKANQLGEVHSLGAWLHRVATFEAGKLVKKNHSRKHREIRAMRQSEIDGDGESLAQKISPLVDESLNALNRKEREIIVMHYFDGLTFKKIGKQLGSSSEAVRKCCSRAIDKLSARLGKQGVTVPAATIAVYFSTFTQESAASIGTATLESIVTKAMANSGVQAASLSSLLITMKIGIIISLTSGALLSAGWAYLQKDQQSQDAPLSSRDGANRFQNAGGVQRATHGRIGFSMELVEHAISHYDGVHKQDPYVESRLRSLMFSVPEKHLGDVYALLAEVKNKSRFQQVASSLFARWAELDPERALKESAAAGDYAWQARRGVLITWLNTDYQAAVDVIVEQRLIADFRHINEFLKHRAERHPKHAAGVVDYLASVWAGSERRTMRVVAQAWSNEDPLAAGEWVAKLPSSDFRKHTLHYLAATTAKINGKHGLTIANHIENKAARMAARNHAINWWAITAGGASVKPGRLSKQRDISSGFPQDWTDQNIRTFTRGTMENFAKDLPLVIQLAENDQQREVIYQGAIDGAAYSQPADVTVAVERVSDDYAQSKAGKRTLMVYAKRWQEVDAVALGKWLETLPEGPKKQALRAGMRKTNK